MQALTLAVDSTQATRVYVYVCARLATWGGCVSMNVHVFVCLCVYVCLFLQECVATSLFIGKLCFCPSTP